MAVALRPVRDDELPAWLERHRRWYAADMVAHGDLGEDAARAKAERDVAALFPGGRPVEGSVLLVVEEDDEPAGNVFGGKEVARGLFRSLGWQEASIHTRKEVA